jgi:excisionase family DNA binding protein
MENTVLTAISFEELQLKFAEIVEDKIKNLLTSNNKKEETYSKQYATRDEVAERLRISLPTLNTLSKSGIIKSYRIGRRVLYNWEEIENVIQEITSTKYKRKDLK